MGTRVTRGAWAGALLLLLLPAITSAAAVDYFLRIDGIEGESTDAGHKGEIEILSWSWGESNAPTRRGGAPGCGLGTAVFETSGAPSSAKLASLQMQKRTLPAAVLTVRGERHMLRNVALTSHQEIRMGDGSVHHRFGLSFVCATHPGGANATFPKVEHKYLKAPGLDGILIGLLLPAVQKVREAPAPMTLGALEIKGTTAILLVKAGDPGTVALQQAFRTGQALPTMKLVGKSPSESWTFTDVKIGSIRPSGTPRYEQISLNFARVDGPIGGFANKLKVE